jgi:hypothetical protein
MKDLKVICLMLRVIIVEEIDYQKFLGMVKAASTSELILDLQVADFKLKAISLLIQMLNL